MIALSELGHVYFVMETGRGKVNVIKGWDEDVLQLSLGQQAMPTATPDYVC
ncbi:hypothetical protein K435DRAFT_874308 [Dendrothele bispora CBS 962.96]|uniref:Uncharacterized protein n=1 Tax=Dendrothele bispora (strain CBS 962.96) TaxID=1314807 RepID=A0A4S8KXD5_DENBC|nr:hypothetical protein K435DRAFT_874308 [Dendrothele bispora CBS 962.96]